MSDRYFAGLKNCFSGFAFSYSISQVKPKIVNKHGQ